MSQNACVHVCVCIKYSYAHKRIILNHYDLLQWMMSHSLAGRDIKNHMKINYNITDSKVFLFCLKFKQIQSQNYTHIM